MGQECGYFVSVYYCVCQHVKVELQHRNLIYPLHVGVAFAVIQQPDLEPLQKLHTYLEAEYSINTTTPSLQDMFGDMSVLTPEILEIKETAALFGLPPEELQKEDLGYWSSIGWYGSCEIIDNGTDCVKYLERAKARSLE